VQWVVGAASEDYVVQGVELAGSLVVRGHIFPNYCFFLGLMFLYFLLILVLSDSAINILYGAADSPIFQLIVE